MANAQPSNTAAAEATILPSGEQSAPAVEDDVWDEERLEKAMKTLKEVHIQLRGLRTAIPRLISPLTTKQPSPEVLFQEFSKAATTANKEVQDFRLLMTEEESAKVFAQARKSRSENPSGIKSWTVTEHPDWLTKDP